MGRPTVMDRFRLDGRTALVTGGSRGLGYAMASALADAGADLVLVSRDADTLAAAAKEIERRTGRRVQPVPGDVSTPAGAEAAVAAALNRAGAIDVLINNVGGRRRDVPTEDLPVEDWQAFFDLNLTSALVCCQMAGRGMLDRGRGSVVNVTSVAGPIAIKGIGGRHYEAAKAALASLTRSLAADWAGRGVRVNALAPGVFDTDPNRKWFREKPEYRGRFLDHIPLGRLGAADEVGPAAVFLASDASSYVTGTTLTVDGGFTCW